MNIQKLLKSTRKGSSIVLVMCVVVILLVMGGALMTLGLHGQLRAVRGGSEIAARTAADAGLVKAVFEMNQMLKDGTWNSSTLPQSINETLPNSDATFSYEVTGSSDTGYVVRCVGNSSYSSRTVSASVRLRGLFDYGILAQGTITLQSGTIVDGYDSQNPGPDDVPVQIATTSDDAGTIDIGSGATIDGEVLVGVDGFFPTVTPPALPDMNTIVVETGTLTITAGESGEYDYINLKQGTVLVIDGGGEVVLYVTGNIDIGQDSELIIIGDTALVIYLDGNLYARNSAGINNTTEDSTNFILYGTGEEQIFDLKAKTEWYGAVYAPNADITIRADAAIYGSFVTANFRTTGGGSHIYYDAALQDVSETDVAAFFAVDRWFEE